MFGLFNRFNRTKEYTILARYRGGHWFKRFVVSGRNGYDACRKFDQCDTCQSWERVSGATVID